MVQLNMALFKEACSRHVAVHCFLAAFLISPLMSTYAQASKALNFDEGQFEQGLMPEGCNNPFREAIRFVGFFETAIVTMAAERGANAKGVANLFAVKYIRQLITEQSGFRGDEESAIDRLIASQLCHYEKIATQKSLGLSNKALQITARDPSLHDHLEGISKNLLSDAVGLYKAEQQALKEAKDQQRFVLSKQQEIRKAKKLGEDKVRSLID